MEFAPGVDDSVFIRERMPESSPPPVTDPEKMTAPITPEHEEIDPGIAALAERFNALSSVSELAWDSKYEGMRVIGRGGQGIVYRCERTGSDGFHLPFALKTFSPSVYACAEDYEADMSRVATVAARVARLQNHHLLDVHNFNEDGGIRIMAMELVNGYDLRQLLNSDARESVRQSASGLEWMHLSDVVFAAGPDQSRLKPGVAIQNGGPKVRRRRTSSVPPTSTGNS